MLGVWAAASRRKARLLDPAKDERSESGPWVQVSRLGNPLFNEVVVPMGQKDKWNALHPAEDKKFAQVRRAPGAAEAAAGALPGRLPEPGGARARSGPTWWRSC